MTDQNTTIKKTKKDDPTRLDLSWKTDYTWVLVANLIYILLFYLLTESFS